MFMGNEAKAVEETPFSEFSAAQLSQNRELDCDVHAGPSTQADYNEIIPEIERNNRDAYKEAWTKILKGLIRPSKYHDLDMLEKAFQDLRAARDKTDTIQLTNCNAALINRPSIGHNGGKSQKLTPTNLSSAVCPASLPLHRDTTRGKGSLTNPGPRKIPTHGYDWRLELYRTHPPKKANSKLIRAILRYHNFESEGEYNTLEDTLALEKIFGLQDIEWDSDADRAMETCERAFRALLRYLTKLGYFSLSTTLGRVADLLITAIDLSAPSLRTVKVVWRFVRLIIKIPHDCQNGFALITLKLAKVLTIISIRKQISTIVYKLGLVFGIIRMLAWELIAR